MRGVWRVIGVIRNHQRVSELCIKHRSYSLLQTIWSRNHLIPLLGSNANRFIHNSSTVQKERPPVKSTPSPPVQQNEKKNAVKIHLYGPDQDDIGKMTFTEARKLADKSNLKLVLLEDQSQGKEKVYQMLGGKELAEEQKRQREIKRTTKKKDVKAMRITSRITKHDLETKTKQIAGWLGKEHEVRITMKNATPQDNKAVSSVLGSITENVSDIAQIKTVKNSETEMIILLQPTVAQGQHEAVRPVPHQDLIDESENKAPS